MSDLQPECSIYRRALMTTTTLKTHTWVRLLSNARWGNRADLSDTILGNIRFQASKLPGISICSKLF
jgi:hypothetical protein